VHPGSSHGRFSIVHLDYTSCPLFFAMRPFKMAAEEENVACSFEDQYLEIVKKSVKTLV